MPCYHPIGAYQVRPGAPLSFKEPSCYARFLYIPCGRCVGCRLEYARQWAIRCVHEKALHEENCFATFTYDAAHLPADLSLRHEDFVLFIKRLRERVGRPIRYYMCGEYGESYSRPHYHACLFGFSPKDKKVFSKNGRGDIVYSSVFLDDVWQQGFSTVGELTKDSAGYVARYVMKKVGSDGPRREILDVFTGEIITRAHEYCRMSLKPGIGARWFEKYRSDVYPHDRVVVAGQQGKPPRYYDVLFGRENPEVLEALKAERIRRADDHFEDSYPRRLRVREVVVKAAISNLKDR